MNRHTHSDHKMFYLKTSQEGFLQKQVKFGNKNTARGSKRELICSLTSNKVVIDPKLSPFSHTRQLLDLRHHLRNLELQPLRKQKYVSGCRTPGRRSGGGPVTHFDIIQKLLFPASDVRQLVPLVVRQVLGNWKANRERGMERVRGRERLFWWIKPIHLQIRQNSREGLELTEHSCSMNPSQGRYRRL